MAERKFFKTVFTIEVLSEDRPLPADMSLKEIEYHITDGDCFGQVVRTAATELSRAEIVSALLLQSLAEYVEWKSDR